MSNANVKTAAFFRPRGFLILLAGGVGSVMAAVLIKWWVLFAGILLTASAYGISVWSSLNDRLFVEEMSRQSLSAAPSPEARLEVLAHTGSRHLPEEYKDDMKRIAENGVKAIRSISQVPSEFRTHLLELPQKVSQIVQLYEKMAIEHKEICRDDGSSARKEELEGAMEKAKATVLQLTEKCGGLSSGNGFVNSLDELSSEVMDDVEAVESVAGELKLLE